MRDDPGGPGGMIVNCAAYCGGRRVADLDVDQIGAEAAREDRFVWIGLHEPDEDLLRRVQRQFGLHDLAVEDAHKAHQRPKLEEYGDTLFVVLHTAEFAQDQILFGETHIFLGKHFIVTVRHGASSSYKKVREKCEGTPERLAKG